MNLKNKKIFRLIIAIIILTQFFGFSTVVLAVAPPVVPVVDVPAFQQKAAIEAKTSAYNALFSTTLAGLLQGVSYFTRKIAYDTAKFISTGGKGQKPLLFTSKWDKYLADEIGNSAATAIEQIGKPYGLNLCSFPDISLQAKLQIGLRTMYDSSAGLGAGPQPTCNWQNMKKSWTQGIDKLSTTVPLGGDVLNYFNNGLDVSQTDFGITLGAIGKIDRLVVQKQLTSINERSLSGGWKDVVSLVSGDIKTPGATVAKEAEALTAKHQGEITTQQIAGMYGSGAVSALTTAGSVFLNTFVSQLINNIFKKGIIPDKTKGSGAAVSDFYAQTIINNKKAVEQAFSFLFTAVPKKSLSAYDIVSEFATCPEGDNYGLNNCVIDGKFQEAINRHKFGEPITVRKAIEDNLLNGDWPLISPLRVADNTSQDCYQKGYCYSNLQKLRKVRILPIGFELAALKSDPDEPWKLKDVVNGFYDCDYADEAKTQVKYNKKFPYCHLIDPDWIIRVPEVRCESKVFGPELVSSGSPERREECVDMSTCITEGKNGECVGEEYYSYCTREKNVWRIGTKECPSQFSTCKSYTDKDGQIRSYLSRTISYGSCDETSVGCAAYSTYKDNTTGKWRDTSWIDYNAKNYGINTSVYLNQNVAAYSCPAQAEGCSAFYHIYKNSAGSYEKGNLVYFKKAPDHLGCYTMQGSVNYEWPKTKSDLAKIGWTGEKCGSFAAPCIESEIGCDLYNPKTGGEPIPGIIGTAEKCDAQCIGYDAFKQKETQFESVKYPVYLIPNNAAICSETEAGCDEFTNLEASAQGGESLEYYSKIKYCEKPTGENIKTFYSWEGDQKSGYILRVHKLRPVLDSYISNLSGISVDIKNEFEKNSPAYANDSKDEIVSNYSLCNPSAYQNMINKTGAGEADPDCRALYNDQGKIYYRMLAKTITVSDQCKALRKTQAEFGVDKTIVMQDVCSSKNGMFKDGLCYRCKGGGQYANGVCVYNAMTVQGESVSCPASANGCRIYKGSISNNLKTIFTNDFEGEITNDWTAASSGGSIKVSSEALQVGFHSLQVDSKLLVKNLNIPVKKGELYTVSFWSRGAPSNISVMFGHTLQELTYISESSKAFIGSNWQEYKYGPIEIGSDAEKAQLVFIQETLGLAETYFLDKVRLVGESGSYALIKDSWKKEVEYNGETVMSDAPLICDSNPKDAFPGVALGCQGYINSIGKDEYATGFEQLCRQEAVGCRAFANTYNTVNSASPEQARIYNLLCKGAVGKCQVKIFETEYSCDIAPGENMCYVKEAILPANVSTKDNVAMAVLAGKLDESSVIIPEDTPVSSPIFLTYTNQFLCNSSYQGCGKVALEEHKGSAVYEFNNESFVLNNPDLYATNNGILCNKEMLGCGKFVADDVISYFKDPRILGGKECVYKSILKEGGETEAGWFKKDGTPCYPDYFEKGGEYQIWSNKSAKYDGYVGECSAEYNGCTELIDREDKTAEQPEGKPYYVIYGDDLTEEANDCEGGVNRKKGCVLFDMTEKLTKLYSTKLSYEANEKEQADKKTDDIFTAPQKGNAQNSNNANLLLKVSRDRECSEWLSCKTSATYIDENGEPRKVCTELKGCTEVKNGKCVRGKKSDFGNEYLSDDTYVTRDVTWFGADYVGYSLLDKFQIHYYDYINLDGQSYVVYKETPAYFAEAFDKQENQTEFGCVTINTKVNKADWVSACGLRKTGRCYQGNCVYPIDKPFGTLKQGETLADVLADVKAALSQQFQCKAYPEKDAPYPQTVLNKPSEEKTDKNVVAPKRYAFSSFMPKFAQANVCQSPEDCSCAYTKVAFEKGYVVDYWPQNQENISGLCISGKNKDNLCTNIGVNEGECGKDGDQAGECAIATKKEQHIGLTGYCAEKDLSRVINGNKDKNGQWQYACLTWLPLDVNTNGMDNFNNLQEAGYYPISGYDSDGKGGEVYCLDARGKKANAGCPWFNMSIEKYFTEGKFLKSYIGAENISCLSDGIMTYQQVLYSVLQEDLGRQTNRHSPLENAVVWYIDITQIARLYIMQLAGWADLNTEGPVNVEGASSADATAFLLQDLGEVDFNALPKSEGKPYLLPNIEKLKENDIQGIFFSPFIPPQHWDLKGGLFSGLLTLSDFNSLYFDIAELSEKNDEQIISGKYKGVTLFNSYNLYNLYKIKGEAKENSNAKRYAMVLDLSKNLTEQDAMAVFSSYIKINSSVSPDAVKSPYMVVYFDFNKETGQIILQDFVDSTALSGVQKRPFFVSVKNFGSAWNCKPDSGDQYPCPYNNLSNRPIMGSSIVLKPGCALFASAYNSNAKIEIGEQNNMAFTNRVWNFAKYITTMISLPRLTTHIPYGSLNILNNQLNQNSLVAYSFSAKEADGVPFACNSTIWPGLNFYGNLKCNGFKSFTIGEITRQTGYDDITEQIYNDPIKNSTSVYKSINHIFAKLFNLYQSDQNAVYTKTNSKMLELSEDAITIPPQIYSINPALCNDKTSGSCPVGEKNNITINGKNGTEKDYNGDGVSDENPSKDGRHKAVIEKESMTAVVQFYAFADDDQMPIRRVMVDWGDGSQKMNSNVYGFYKNRKPYCDKEDGVKDSEIGYCMPSNKTSWPGFIPQVTCKAGSKTDCSTLTNNKAEYICASQDALKEVDKNITSKKGEYSNTPRFGNAPRACIEGYFEFSHTYECQENNQVKLSSIQDKEIIKLLKLRNITDPEDKICVYTPKVQVLDNWGWCNGTCNPNNGGCWNYASKEQCKSDTLDNWTSYQSKIIVIP